MLVAGGKTWVVYLNGDETVSRTTMSIWEGYVEDTPYPSAKLLATGLTRDEAIRFCELAKTEES